MAFLLLIEEQEIVRILRSYFSLSLVPEQEIYFQLCVTNLISENLVLFLKEACYIVHPLKINEYEQ
jgi:hypothetical protein